MKKFKDIEIVKVALFDSNLKQSFVFRVTLRNVAATIKIWFFT